jgi:hypothetical protein
MTPSALAATLDARSMKRLPTSTPDDTRPRRVEDARSPLHRDKWPGLTTAQSLAVASQFGVSLAVGVGLGLVAGQWLDGQVHTGLLFAQLCVPVRASGARNCQEKALLPTREPALVGRIGADTFGIHHSV